jgi:nucleoside phosphorylase
MTGTTEREAVKAKADILLVTVTRVESAAVRNVFQEATGRQAVPMTVDDRVYQDLGRVNNARVFMALSEMGTSGPGGASQTVTKAIEALSPSAVILVGIAFGVDAQKQRIGDILVSQQLMLYDLARVSTEEGKLQINPRGDRPHASTRLLNRCRAAELTWDEGVASVKVGLILSGDKLVDNLDYRSQLLALEREAIGGEMEGAGLYVACQDANKEWIVIKAICEWGDGHKDTDKDKRQELAAYNAARFALHMLQNAPWHQQNDASASRKDSDPNQATDEEKTKLVWMDRPLSECNGLPNFFIPEDLPAPENDNIGFEERWIGGSPVRLHKVVHRFFEWQFKPENQQKLLAALPNLEHTAHGSEWYWFKVEPIVLDSSLGRQGKIAEARIIGCRDGLPAEVWMVLDEYDPILEVKSTYRDWLVLENAWRVFRDFMVDGKYIEPRSSSEENAKPQDSRVETTGQSGGVNTIDSSIAAGEGDVAGRDKNITINLHDRHEELALEMCVLADKFRGEFRGIGTSFVSSGEAALVKEGQDIFALRQNAASATLAKLYEHRLEAKYIFDCGDAVADKMDSLRRVFNEYSTELQSVFQLGRMTSEYHQAGVLSPKTIEEPRMRLVDRLFGSGWQTYFNSVDGLVQEIAGLLRKYVSQ